MSANLYVSANGACSWWQCMPRVSPSGDSVHAVTTYLHLHISTQCPRQWWCHSSSWSMSLSSSLRYMAISSSSTFFAWLLFTHTLVDWTHAGCPDRWLWFQAWNCTYMSLFFFPLSLRGERKCPSYRRQCASFINLMYMTGSFRCLNNFV